MYLTVLGSGSFQPTKQRGPSGYIIENDNVNILLDAGPGTLRQLSRINISAHNLNYIIFSHLHPDHTGDLIGILFARQNQQSLTGEKLNIYGPPGFNVFFDNFLCTYDKYIKDHDKIITVNEYNDTVEFENWKLNCYPVLHTDNSHGFRIENHENKSISYSGDTGFCDSLFELFADCDLGIIECSTPDKNKIDGHMCPSDIIKVFSKVNCRSLLITHIYADNDSEFLLDNFKSLNNIDIKVATELEKIKI